MCNSWAATSWPSGHLDQRNFLGSIARPGDRSIYAASGGLRTPEETHIYTDALIERRAGTRRSTSTNGPRHSTLLSSQSGDRHGRISQTKKLGQKNLHCTEQILFVS